MLAALILNLQNDVQAQPASTIYVDRGGGGPSWPRHEFVDILAAVAAFPEFVGEDAVARAVRRHKWIGEALPRIKEAREKREAAAFLAGAQLADAVVREEFAAAARDAAPQAAADKLSVEQMVKIIDEVRAADAPPRVPALRDRGVAAAGGTFGGAALVLGLVLGGLAIGVAIGRTQRKGRNARTLRA